MLHVSKDPDSLLIALADFIVGCAKDVYRKIGQLPLSLFPAEALLNGCMNYYHRIRTGIELNGKKFFSFLAMKRYVPADHSNSNFLMVKNSLFVPLKISDQQIFAVNTSLAPSDAASDYEQQLRNHFNGEECRFDLILLGLGDNSHTASLFPHTSVLHEKQALVERDLCSGGKYVPDNFHGSADQCSGLCCVSCLWSIKV
jgi:6-phosphogluconolactonase